MAVTLRNLLCCVQTGRYQARCVGHLHTERPQVTLGFRSIWRIWHGRGTDCQLGKSVALQSGHLRIG